MKVGRKQYMIRLLIYRKLLKKEKKKKKEKMKVTKKMLEECESIEK